MVKNESSWGEWCHQHKDIILMFFMWHVKYHQNILNIKLYTKVPQDVIHGAFELEL